MSSFLVITAMGACVIAGTIDLDNLFDYQNQTVPNYINRDNTGTNAIDDATATLGRVLFYDKKLSTNDTVSCASCHKQEFAFSDLAVVSQGVNGVTGRHSMRLINSRFSDEGQFFWDERAATLEDQTTQPIRDHVEMGFSGQNGNPNFDDLITKLESTTYYKALFEAAFGDDVISEARMQLAIAQFIRSIQSFDSKFDDGLAQANGNLNANFPNFTASENQGKNLFLAPPRFNQNGVRTGGGLGCGGCHQAPEFSIDDQSRNNGVITVANDPSAIDLTNTKSPTLRDLLSPSGTLNGPMMHDGSFATFDAVIDHYNDITFDPAVNPDLGVLLRGGPQGQGQKLMMTQNERDALTAFIRTLTGSEVYTNERWSAPFEADGTFILLGAALLGDINQDGSIDFSDISSFISVLINGDYMEEADINQDGVVTFEDISPFITLLLSQ